MLFKTEQKKLKLDKNEEKHGLRLMIEKLNE